MRDSRIHASKSILKIVRGGNAPTSRDLGASSAVLKLRRTVAGFGGSSIDSKIVKLPLPRPRPLSRHLNAIDVERALNFRRPESAAGYAGSDRSYAERMKVHAVIFVFLVFFILSGVWLMEGLKQAFG